MTLLLWTVKKCNITLNWLNNVMANISHAKIAIVDNKYFLAKPTIRIITVMCIMHIIYIVG
jgi:hypothetical protein